MISNRRYLLLCVVFTVAYISLRLVSHEDHVALVEPLSTFPTTLGNWQSHDLPLEARTIRGLGFNDYINRLYENTSGDDVGLYVAYYQSQKTGITIHSPKNCLPGVGWQPLRADSLELMGPDAHRVRVNMYEVEKGIDREIVLYWYQSHGRLIASEYWAKVYLVLDGLRIHRTDAALVRISTPVYVDTEEARERAAQFAQSILPQLNILTR